MQSLSNNIKHTFKLSVAVMPEPLLNRCIDLNLNRAQRLKPEGFFIFTLLPGALRGDPQNLCNCRRFPKQINMTISNTFSHSLRFWVKTLGKGLSFWKQNGSKDLRFYKIWCGLTLPLVRS